MLRRGTLDRRKQGFGVRSASGSAGTRASCVSDTQQTPASLQRGYFQPVRPADRERAPVRQREHTRGSGSLSFFECGISARGPQLEIIAVSAPVFRRRRAGALRNFPVVFRDFCGTRLAQWERERPIPLAVVMTRFEPGAPSARF